MGLELYPSGFRGKVKVFHTVSGTFDEDVYPRPSQLPKYVGVDQYDKLLAAFWVRLGEKTLELNECLSLEQIEEVRAEIYGGPDTKFSLWKNNRIDQEYKLTVKEILDRFFASPQFKRWHDEVTDPKSVTVSGPLEYFFRLWVGTPEKDGGLQSVMDTDDHFKFDALVRNEWRAILAALGGSD